MSTAPTSKPNLGSKLAGTAISILLLVVLVALFTVLPLAIAVVLVMVVHVGFGLYRYERWYEAGAIPREPFGVLTPIAILASSLGFGALSVFVVVPTVAPGVPEGTYEMAVGALGLLSLGVAFVVVWQFRAVLRRDYANRPSISLVAWDSLSRLPLIWFLLFLFGGPVGSLGDYVTALALVAPGVVAWVYLSVATDGRLASRRPFVYLSPVVGAGGTTVPDRFRRRPRPASPATESARSPTVTTARRIDETTGEPDAATESNTEDQDGIDEWVSPVPDIDFDDVAGMDALKAEFRESIISPLADPESHRRYGLTVLNGCILYGPPGVGKTYISKALAGELGYSYLELSPARVSSKWVGEPAQKIEAAFAAAKQHQPCLVFVDELDAVATSRSEQMSKTERDAINQLLIELQNVKGTDVVVIGATNYLDGVDEAVRRTGRFDLKIEVPPPDEGARIALFRAYLEGRPVDGSISFDELASVSAGLVASDVETVCDRAARLAKRRNGRISMGDIRRAIADL